MSEVSYFAAVETNKGREGAGYRASVSGKTVIILWERYTHTPHEPRCCHSSALGMSLESWHPSMMDFRARAPVAAVIL